MSIERILIPTDFSETAELAVSHGAYMAHLYKAKVYLLHSIHYPVYTFLPDEPVITEQEIPPEKDIEEKLIKTADGIMQKYHVELVTLTATGRPAKGISEAARENKIDIIVMGTHGASGFEEFFVGSNTLKVVNMAQCPVISVQKSAKRVGFSNIVMPIDNDLHSRQKTNNAIELASVYKSTIHILGLLQMSDNKTEEQKLELKLDSVEENLKKAGITYTRELIRGHNPAIETLNYSDEVKGDLIMVMTGYESTMGSTFLGAFAEQIVNHSRIPVMSIKPAETTIETFDISGGTGVII